MVSFKLLHGLLFISRFMSSVRRFTAHFYGRFNTDRRLRGGGGQDILSNLHSISHLGVNE